MQESDIHTIWKCLYKGINALAKFPGLGRAMAGRRIQTLRENVLARYVAGLPDRRYWSAAIMPVLLKAGFKKILFVGCGSYTRHVHEEFESTGCECWTTDIVPDNAVWGNPRRHLVCDIADIRKHVPDAQFDAVLFNGVMGYGVTGAHMAAIAPALHASMHARGLLLIGWNTGLVEDPLTLPCVTDLFIHAGPRSLPARKTFTGCSHVYDWFSKSTPTAASPVSS